MAKVYLGATAYKLYFGSTKIKKAYLGATRVYSSGNIVTYHVNTGVTYTEEVDEGASVLSPSFTPSKSGWTFLGWRSDATTNPDCYTSYVMGENPVTLYAVFRQAVTVTYYNGSTSASSTSGYRYYNNGNIVNASFTLTQAALSGWTARGWSAGTAANSGIAYANGAAFTSDGDITLYGMYQQAVTLSYSGNGATGGSTAAQTGYRYYNSGTNLTVNPSFALKTNGYTYSGKTWKTWALGSVSGTRHAAGSVLTLSASTSVYAVWKVPINYRTAVNVQWTIQKNWDMNVGASADGWSTSTYEKENGEAEWTSQNFPVNECDTLTIQFSELTPGYVKSVQIRDQNNNGLGEYAGAKENTDYTINVSGKTSVKIYERNTSDEWHRSYIFISKFSMS